MMSQPKPKSTSKMTTCFEDLKRIAVEISNLGVLFHESDRLDDAEALYRDALQALITCESETNDKGQEELGNECIITWNDALICWKDMAADYLTCEHTAGSSLCESSRTTPFGSHEPLVLPRPLLLDPNASCELNSETITLLLLHNMALAKALKGENSKAVQLLEFAMARIPKETSVGSNIAAVATVAVHFSLGVLCFQEKRHDDAYNLFMNAFQLGGSALGDHPLVAFTLNAIGHILFMSNEFQDAMEAFNEASRIFHRCFCIDVKECTNADLIAPAA